MSLGINSREAMKYFWAYSLIAMLLGGMLMLAAKMSESDLETESGLSEPIFLHR
jgi:hypothetical protein